MSREKILDATSHLIQTGGISMVVMESGSYRVVRSHRF